MESTVHTHVTTAIKCSVQAVTGQAVPFVEDIINKSDTTLINN